MTDTPQENSTGLPTLERFREFNSTFPHAKEVLDFKEQGGKVFGWLCTYVPEEIIHAAGVLPIRITGYREEVELDDGTAYLYVNSCSFSRSCFQLGLRGEYDFLDGVVGGSTCDGARRLFDVWRQYIGTPFHHVLNVPRKYTERAHQLYLDQVMKFKQHLEEFLGSAITDEALRGSIDLYNESRALLRELYELRKLDELSESNIRHRSRARLMITGSVMENPEFIRTIEGEGALVVADELCTSTRYWSDPVVLDGSTSPLEAVSRRYLNNFPCARMYPSDERFDRIADLIKEFRVDGVVSEIIRYCVPYAHDLPLLTHRLTGQGIPVLALDVEYGTSGSGQIKTRVQAFLEMLEAKKR